MCASIQCLIIGVYDRYADPLTTLTVNSLESRAELHFCRDRKFPTIQLTLLWKTQSFASCHHEPLVEATSESRIKIRSEQGTLAIGRSISVRHLSPV